MSGAAQSLSTKDLYERADSVELGVRQCSLPIPVRAGNHIEVWFFYYDSRADPPSGVLFWRPERLRRFSRSGELLSTRAFPSPHWHADRADDLLIVPPKRPRLCTPQECQAARECLLCDLDALLPAFEAGARADPQLAARVVRQLDLLAEANLRFLHEQIGREFFVWLFTSVPAEAR